MLARSKIQSLVWVGIGTISLVTGIVGIFLPLLPTTPFLLLTAFCYARGSPHLHARLLAHPRFGKPILDWEKGRVIRIQVKWLVTLMMVVSMSFPIYWVAAIPLAVRIGIGLIGGAVLIFIWSQKSES